VENQLLSLLVILASVPLKMVLENSSKSAVKLEMLEFLWEKMEDPKVLPMLNLIAIAQLRVP